MTTTSDRRVLKSSARCWDTKGKVNSKTGRFSAGHIQNAGIPIRVIVIPKGVYSVQVGCRILGYQLGLR